ncbi:VOC family protein [Altererythrobacter sp. CC-YST694]|uniref:VOC family protein n=1 Tax=Altererythrobacter sp. CC-YST694 TaxID=2755038 RepID=UPI001D030491|nr:VOC family protein [Altererythrobacter sp. CC-YST694]MCB5425088.1 VOC family protein [Altererythrobacter sp. CC-YST694]
MNQIVHSVGPRKATWTHLALAVKSVDDTIAWYEKYTHLRVLRQREDEDGKNVWLADPNEKERAFVLVAGQFFEGHDPFAPKQHLPLGPFAHIGIELPTREAVDAVAELAREGGCLALGPMQFPKEDVGYICFLKDPDGNTIEFSYDQGVFEAARDLWQVGADA